MNAAGLAVIRDKCIAAKLTKKEQGEIERYLEWRDETGVCERVKWCYVARSEFCTKCFRVYQNTPSEWQPPSVLNNQSRGIKKYDPNMGYVYFLVDNEELVYIGQTAKLHQRIAAHQKNPAKPFTDVYYLELIKDKLLSVERWYINQYCPKYNKTSGRRVIPPHEEGYAQQKAESEVLLKRMQEECRKDDATRKT